MIIIQFMKGVVAQIHQLNDNQIKQLEANQSVEIKIEEIATVLEPSDVIIESKDIEGWLVANGNGLTVALDIQLTDTLIEEGVARELINRIQNLRKDSGLEVTDKIILYLKEDVTLTNVFEKHLDYIKQETLTEKIIVESVLLDGENLEFDQVKTIVNLEKI